MESGAKKKDSETKIGTNQKVGAKQGTDGKKKEQSQWKTNHRLNGTNGSPMGFPGSSGALTYICAHTHNLRSKISGWEKQS